MILKVGRISDRIINVKLAYGNSMLNVISAYYMQHKSEKRRLNSMKKGDNI